LENDGTNAGGAAEPAAERSARWTRVEWLCALFLCLVTTAHWLPRLRGPLDLRYDAGVYYVLGTSLAEGRGYRLLNEPGAIQAVQYPPLLPALVALHELALGTHDPLVVAPALRASSFVLSLVYALAVYALARRWLGPWSALFAALLAVLYFHTVYLEDLLFAEVPFALTAVLFFLAHGARSARARACAFPLAAAAFYLRTAGIALLAAWVLEALVARRWKSGATRAALAGACVLAWQGYVWSVIGGAEYRAPSYSYQRAPYQFYNVSYAENVALRDPFAPELGRVTPLVLAERALASVPRLVTGLGESVSAPRGFWEWPLKKLDRRLGLAPRAADDAWAWYDPLVLAPLALLGLAVVVGLVLLARSGARALGLFVLCTLALVALLPWPAQIPRYLSPSTPLFTIALLRALSELRGRGQTVAAGMLVVVFGAQAFTLQKTFTVYFQELDFPRASGPSVRGTAFFFDEAPAWRAYYAALWWLRANAAPGAVVATSCPHLAWIHTGHPAVLPPFEAEPARAQADLESAGVEYVVLDALAFVDVTQRYARPTVEAHPERWALAYRDPGERVTIYRRR